MMVWDRGKIKNWGRFNERVKDKVSVAEQQNQAPQAPNSFVLKRKWNPPVRTAWLFGLGILAILACAGIGWPVVKSMVADLTDIIFGAVFIVIVVAVHGVTSWWCARNRPGSVPVLIVQAPLPVLYGMTWVWFKVGFDAGDGGPPSLWYLPWAAVAAVSLSWLIVYRLRSDAAARVSKVFASGLAVWLAVNGGGFALDRWNAANGFGFKGYPTPPEALHAFTATSCVFKLTWYTKGGKSREATCNRYTDHKNNGPAEAFASTISTGQPREALEHWWQAVRQFRELQMLEEVPPIVRQENGDTATIRPKVSSPHWKPYRLADYHCFTSGRDESWTVHLEKVTFGGWKVSRVDIDQAVTVVPFTGSPCDRQD